MVQVAEANRIQFAKNAGHLVVPAPPEISREGPQAFLSGSDETRQITGLADDGGNLGGRIGQHPDFLVQKDAGLNGLNHKYALQNAPLDDGNSKERLELILACFTKVFEA